MVACLRKQCFVHWYTAAGIDKREFAAVDDCFADISSIYRGILENNKAPGNYKL